MRTLKEILSRELRVPEKDVERVLVSESGIPLDKWPDFNQYMFRGLLAALRGEDREKSISELLFAGEFK